MSLQYLQVCIDENNIRAYEDVTAGEYLNIRLIEIGLKIFLKK